VDFTDLSFTFPIKLGEGRPYGLEINSVINETDINNNCNNDGTKCVCSFSHSPSILRPILACGASFELRSDGQVSMQLIVISG
jgi:hypothetical protein